MKILVIFTGGTIGSSVADGWIGPNEDMKYLLVNKYCEATGDGMHFSTLSPYTVLSENLSAEHLNILIKSVSENIEKYDGIIVTHGTDTLQYSAAALSYALGGDTVPVVLVSANYPLDDEKSNGLDNFIAAAEFIKNNGGRGVFVSYKNREKRVNIHSASRLLVHAELSDEVFSLDEQPYAFFEEGKIILNPDYIPDKITAKAKNAYFCSNPKILVVSAMPGDNFDYNVSKYNAVILRPYHSGTLNTASSDFIGFCNEAKNKNIPVYLVNAPSGVTYESSKLYKELGIKILENSTFIATYIKVWLEMKN